MLPVLERPPASMSIRYQYVRHIVAHTQLGSVKVKIDVKTNKKTVRNKTSVLFGAELAASVPMKFCRKCEENVSFFCVNHRCYHFMSSDSLLRQFVSSTTECMALKRGFCNDRCSTRSSVVESGELEEH